jgi:3-dehydrotetronate 4-kinase
MLTMILGCIADDFTGATDVANNLVRAGMRVVQIIGVPSSGDRIDNADAVVVALKSRTAPVEAAVADCLAAASWLRGHGAQQIYFKVCSTFDSTPQGNIGPVTEALLQAVRGDFAIVTPAFPENGRTVFKGHLFVGDLLLSDSPMKHHPLTPMTDANLVRVMQAQCRQARVGLIDHRVVVAGVPAVRSRMAALRSEGCTLGIADAVSDDDLRTLAAAAHDHALVVAGSGLAIGIPALHGMAPSVQAAQLPPAQGACAIVSGSCSAATHAQVAAFIAQGGAAWAVDPLRLAAGQAVVAEALAWARPRQCFSTPRPTALRCAACSRAWARSTLEPWWNRPWRRWRWPWSMRAWVNWCWPAAKRPAPVCRPWASDSCASARRSIRACRGAMRRRRGCIWL